MIPWWWYETKRNEMKKNLFIFNVGYFNRMCLHSSESNEFFFWKSRFYCSDPAFFSVSVPFPFLSSSSSSYVFVGIKFSFRGLIFGFNPSVQQWSSSLWKENQEKFILMNDIFQCQIFFSVEKIFIKVHENNEKQQQNLTRKSSLF